MYSKLRAIISFGAHAPASAPMGRNLAWMSWHRSTRPCQISVVYVSHYF